MNEQFIRIKDIIINKDQISYIMKFISTIIIIYFKTVPGSTEESRVIFKSEKERDIEFNKILDQLCGRK